MNKGILITLPQSDDVTEYLAAFSNSLIFEIEKLDIKTKVLRKSEANRYNFEKILKSLNYNFIFFNGHGDINCITGHKQEEIIKVGQNEEILQGRIIYARSCWAAEGVGNAVVEKNNNSCFIGYNIPFMFLIDITRATNPIKDHIAEIFFNTTNLIPLLLAKGKKTNEANESSKNAMLKAIKKALLKKDKDSETIAEILWNNYSGQVLLGNSEATV